MSVSNSLFGQSCSRNTHSISKFSFQILDIISHVLESKIDSQISISILIAFSHLFFFLRKFHQHMLQTFDQYQECWFFWFVIYSLNRPPCKKAKFQFLLAKIIPYVYCNFIYVHFYELHINNETRVSITYSPTCCINPTARELAKVTVWFVSKLTDFFSSKCQLIPFRTCLHLLYKQWTPAALIAIDELLALSGT